MAFQPVDSLRSRTFIGLLVAQFLAAFNDQAIHASAMFFAIRHATLTADNAISMMPILFYAPWALFCTLAGWLADRYSKRQSLVFWKIAEIGITAIALLGFWLGTEGHTIGPWIVLSTVFLMGTHSAFFVPAKYGAMPEILPPHLLSRGNGLLESLSFLAVILGTVCGGVLSSRFKGEEYWIGVVLLTLAVIGAVASFLIEKMPAANPDRPFPTNLVKPLIENLRILLRSKPLALAVLGIAFFTFIVAFMRGTVYLHGETRNPRWDELHTSIVVGVVALGVGLGSPLAGFCSGGKIELGLVPLGAVGMTVSLLVAALTLNTEPALIVCLVLIGFSTGFYIVPLFTLLQHRAPKTSKGDLLASSNFINVVGAIAASFLFKGLILGAESTRLLTPVTIHEVTHGRLTQLNYTEHGHPSRITVGAFTRNGTKKPLPGEKEPLNLTIIELKGDPEIGSEVVVGTYHLTREGHRVEYYRVQPADERLGPAYDKEPLTGYLFLSGGLMTLGMLVLLCRQFADFFVRSLLWRSWGRYRVRVFGLHHLPTDGPVILATNCARFDDCLHVVGATDRFTRFLFPAAAADAESGPLVHYLARRTGLIPLPADAGSEEFGRAVAKGARTLKLGNMVGLTLAGPEDTTEMILQRLTSEVPATVVPVYCDPEGVRVVLGPPVRDNASVAEIQQAVQELADVVEEAAGHEAVGAMH